MTEEFEACGSFVRTKRPPDDTSGDLVAECAHSNGFGEQTAKLFAAAPLMLVALKEIEAYAKRDGDLVGQAIASIAGEAIGKAERNSA